VKLQIWDTARQERFHSITRSYFRASAAVLLIDNVMKRESFGKLGVWVETMMQLSPPTAVKVLIGNKTDLPAKVGKIELNNPASAVHRVPTAARGKAHVGAEPLLLIFSIKRLADRNVK
jgi:GTPase SAR1 family protein